MKETVDFYRCYHGQRFVLSNKRPTLTPLALVLTA